MQHEFNKSKRADAAIPSRNNAARPRVAFYSQDIVGLGHLRRNLLIAQTLGQSELAATCLMISGAHEANFFSIPDGIDCVTLPRIGRDPSGRYRSARLDMSLDELVKFRQKLICSALDGFDPDVFIVDFRPTGVCDELIPALKVLAKRGRTRIVLGLRDVLDEVTVVQTEWLSPQKVDVVDRFYDAVWIYGDPCVFNPVHKYRFPRSIAKKTRFTGYLDQTARLKVACNGSHCGTNGKARSRREVVACVVGGGSDGATLIETFIKAVTPDIDAVVLTGPYTPRIALEAARRAVAELPNVQIVEFSREADQIMAQADRVVSMAGYNTVCSILSFGKPALLVPRVTPRREQWIRANIFRRLNLVDVISPDVLTAEDIAAWLCHPVNNMQSARSLVDLRGLDRIVEWTASLLPTVADRMALTPVTIPQGSGMEARR